MEYAKFGLTRPTKSGRWLGIDPGINGGMAMLHVDAEAQIRTVEWAVEWQRRGPGFCALEHDGGRHVAPTLFAMLNRIHIPDCEVVIELTNVHGPKAGIGTLLKMTGYIQAFADSRGLKRTEEPQQTVWVADVLACPPSHSEDGCVAALKGVRMAGSRRIVDWGLRGKIVDRMASGKAPVFGRHANDALAMALWGSGARLTAAGSDR